MRAAFACSAALFLLATGGCSEPTPTPEPTAPARPGVPVGWRTITSDEGDLKVVLPQELIVTRTAGAIVGRVDVELVVHAVAPAALAPREGGQSLLGWLEAGAWIPNGSEAADRRAATERELMLPAGPALELAATYEAGTADEYWAIVYVVATPRGDAILRLSGSGSNPDAFIDQIRLIRELVIFG